MINNTFRLYNHILDQSSRKERAYQCTIYSCAVNLSYNCGIKLTLDQLDEIASRMFKKGTLKDGYGAKFVDTLDEVLRYLKEKGYKVKVISTNSDTDVKYYMSKYYSVITGISVNKKFIEDVPDGKIDTKDYAEFKGNDLKHYLNMIHSEGNGKDYFIDNYSFNTAGREWLYEMNLKEVLEDIDQNLKYIFLNS